MNNLAQLLIHKVKTNKKIFLYYICIELELCNSLLVLISFKLLTVFILYSENGCIRFFYKQPIHPPSHKSSPCSKCQRLSSCSPILSKFFRSSKQLSVVDSVEVIRMTKNPDDSVYLSLTSLMLSAVASYCVVYKALQLSRCFMLFHLVIEQ